MRSVLVSALLFWPFFHLLSSESLKVSLVGPDIVKRRLAEGMQPHDQRETTIHNLFAAAGCSTSTQPVHKRASNVVCTLAGETDSVVVVGAHYDYVKAGQGIIDDWSGTSLLPSLYEALKTFPRKHTFVFVALAAEEEGLVGSRRYVKQLTKEQRANIHAFVNLECLGLDTPKVWAKRSTPELIKLLLQVTTSIGVKLAGVSLDQVGDDDTHSFKDIKVPVISIHSITQESFPMLHSDADTLQAINPEMLYEAYRAVAFYLAHLDNQLPLRSQSNIRQ